MDLEKIMKTAVKEAEESLREGNCGFGAVIVKEDNILAASHDREVTEEDPTSHAEINAIRQACKRIGRDLSGCTLVCTHEPCPMCATAAVWAGIGCIAYGYSIEEAIKQGRKRIDIRCREIFARAGREVRLHENILHGACSVLYRKDVRDEIKKLRNANEGALNALNEESTNKRVAWFKESRDSFDFLSGDLLDSAYRLLLTRFKITERQAPVVKKSRNEIVFHSKNFCPTLEACRILGLDTRTVCRSMNEKSTDTLLKQLDSRLNFRRNYECLRPYSDYCEESIYIL